MTLPLIVLQNCHLVPWVVNVKLRRWTDQLQLIPISKLKAACDLVGRDVNTTDKRTSELEVPDSALIELTWSDLMCNFKYLNAAQKGCAC